MILSLQATTNVSDIFIDFIEVKLKSGKIISLNWNESEFSCDVPEFSAIYIDVNFNEEDSNGRISELKGMKIVHVELYSESKERPEIEIMKMEFEDGDDRLVFTPHWLSNA